MLSIQERLRGARWVQRKGEIFENPEHKTMLEAAQIIDEQNTIDKRIDAVMNYVRFRSDRCDDRIYNIEQHLNIMRFWTIGSVIVAMLSILFIVLTVGGK